MVFEFYQDANFWIVAIGTMALSLALCCLGSVQVVKRQSLIGDAVGHSTLPGLVLMFIVFRQRDPFLFFLGAFMSALLAYGSIAYGTRKTTLKPDVLMAMVLSSFFGLGLALKTLAQKIPGAAQAKFQSYIFGQAAFLREKEIYPLIFMALFVLVFFTVYYRKIKLYLFDASYGHLLGFSEKKMHWMTTALSLLLIAVGIKAVGGILITSLFLAPVIAARQWVKNYGAMLALGMLFSVISAFIGTLLSYYYKGFSTGASIVVCLSVLALFSIIFSPRGLLYRFYLRFRQRRNLTKEIEKQC